MASELRTEIVAMSADDYHADPCTVPSLSSSIAHILVTESELHAWAAHPKLGNKRKPKSSKAFDHGSLVHELILGEGRGYVAIDADDYRTKKAQEQRDAARAEGKTPVLSHQLTEARESAAIIMAELINRGVRLNGTSEVAILWVEQADDGTPVQCRAMLDHLAADLCGIWDLKTTESCAPEKVRASIESYGYDIQATAYLSALAAVKPELAGRVPYTWIFVENDQPYAVNICEMDGTMRELGMLRWRRAVNMWAQCMRTNTWPGYRGTQERPERIAASQWRLAAELERSYANE
jgi:hypothetical protein